MQLLESTYLVVFISRIISRRRIISDKSEQPLCICLDPQLVKTGTKLCMSSDLVMLMILMLASTSKIISSDRKTME